MRTERRERLPVSISAAIFIEDKEGRLLLLQQAAKWKEYKWGPLAGGMHPYENPIRTAIRETKEELGVGVELIDLIGIYTAFRGNNASGIAFVFRGKIVSGEINLRKEEIMNFGYFSKEEIQKLIARGEIYKPEYNLPSIRDWLAGTSYPISMIKE